MRVALLRRRPTQLVHRIDERIGLRCLDDHLVGMIGKLGRAIERERLDQRFAERLVAAIGELAVELRRDATSGSS